MKKINRAFYRKCHSKVICGLHVFAGIFLLSLSNVYTAVMGFEDITYWTGSGANQSALIVQWNDAKAPQALAWGFRWDTPVNVYDMFLSIVSADVRLFARLDSNTNSDAAIFGLGYDLNNNGNFGVTGAVDPAGNPTTVLFTGGVSDTNTDVNTYQPPSSSLSAIPSDPDDHYVEGWYDNGYWAFYTAIGTIYGTLNWSEAPLGISDTNLENNGWYALCITEPDFSMNPPGSATAAVPEPQTYCLIFLGLGLCAIYARKRIYAA